jgi:hypothetical protein
VAGSANVGVAGLANVGMAGLANVGMAGLANVGVAGSADVGMAGLAEANPGAALSDKAEAGPVIVAEGDAAPAVPAVPISTATARPMVRLCPCSIVHPPADFDRQRHVRPGQVACLRSANPRESRHPLGSLTVA